MIGIRASLEGLEVVEKEETIIWSSIYPDYEERMEIISNIIHSYMEEGALNWRLVPKN